MKPVAWQWLDTANFRKSISNKANKNEWRPLYTKPQYRELSDEEIKAIENSVKYSELALSHDEYMTKFAHLILKKAMTK